MGAFDEWSRLKVASLARKAERPQFQEANKPHPQPRDPGTILGPFTLCTNYVPGDGSLKRRPVNLTPHSNHLVLVAYSAQADGIL